MKLFFKIIFTTWLAFNLLAAMAGYNECSSPFGLGNDYTVRNRLDVLVKGSASIGYQAGCWLAGSPEVTSDVGDSEE